MAKQVNPLPYIIVFIILFITSLIVLTWMLDVFNKNIQCTMEPNIWCSDEWYCQSACTGGQSVEGPVSSCYENAGPSGTVGYTGITGLANCLFGPNAPGATVCFEQPAQTGATALACDCPTILQSGVGSCLSGCPLNLNSVNNATVCCCNEGPGCTKNAPECNVNT
jgi:hypothetical protein